MPLSFIEDSYEKALIELFRDRLGYDYVYGPDVENRNFQSPLYDVVLRSCIGRINPWLPEAAIVEAIKKIREFESGPLEQKNETFMDYLQSGVSVRYYETPSKPRSVLVKLVDYEKPENNSFIVANQWTFEENSIKRPDILLFLNGIPVVLMELKSPSREETNSSQAYRQIRNYMQEIPSMFIYNAICVVSDMMLSKAGTITSGEDRYMEWKTKDGSYENTQYAQFDTFMEGMFQKERLLDIIKNFICFSNDGVERKKILAGYHQYFAVKKAIECTKLASAEGGDGKGGVFWHTQGSGKSLSMVFYAHLLQEALESPTIVVLTDRNDLDEQLFGQFSRCREFLRQTPEQAQSRDDLKRRLSGREANGIIFTTMQKFTESAEALSERRNIVVIADEAHRGQYGLAETFKVKENEAGDREARRAVGMARMVRETLPNATYIGFTGTPISRKDRCTREVFGDYIDIYDMTQAVEDGATRPVYYESRVMKLKLNEDVLKKIDDEYAKLAESTDPEVIEKSKKMLGQMDAILGNEHTIQAFVDDVLDHYENHRKDLLTGKAMIVAYSREIALKIYRRILKARPTWEEKVAVVMTETNDDPEDWRQIIGNKHRREELAKQFKDNESPLKIAIVVDMWLTGFDVPSLATMYIYKHMEGHNLMQAIARVNRVFGDKEGGLIVDYVGIATALRYAMKEYSPRDQEQFRDLDIAKTAYQKFQEKLSVCRALLHGFDYSKFLDEKTTALARGQLITGAVNFLVDPKKEEKKKDFQKEALLLRQALSLCSSLASKKERYEAAFFEPVRVLIQRISYSSSDKPLSLPEINKRINELLEQSIKSEGVINLFSDEQKGFSLFDPKFLEKLSKMREKNLAVEILRKLIAEQVRLYKRTNLVKSQEFSELIRQKMQAYLNGLLTNEEVIKELVEIAKQVARAHAQGEELGLTPEELAFYDAITKPQGIKDFYENEVLIKMTQELTEALRKNKTIDWQKRAGARAKMMLMVHRLLKKYKYPPEEMEGAIDTVMSQCELWADNQDYVQNTMQYQNAATQIFPDNKKAQAAEKTDDNPYGPSKVD